MKLDYLTAYKVRIELDFDLKYPSDKDITDQLQALISDDNLEYKIIEEKIKI